MGINTPKVSWLNIAEGTPVIRRLLGSLEDGEEIDFTKWTDEDRVANNNNGNMKEQLGCCVIGEASFEEKIVACCAPSSRAIAFK